MINILKKINNNKSEKTIITYNSLLNNLLKNMNIEIDDKFKPNFFIDYFDEVNEFLNNNIKNLYTKKTLISAILNLLRYYDNIDSNNTFLNNLNKIKLKYTELLDINTKKIDKNKEDNIKTDKENKNWIDYKDIINIYNNLYNKYYKYLSIKNISPLLFDELQNLIILSFYIFLEPRRLEYADLKYKNYDKNIDNYIDIKKKKIYLNKYKTSKKKGLIILDIKEKIFINLIKKFIDLKKENNFNSDYLFNGINSDKLTPSQLTIRINKIFGKNISVSMIRKSYLTLLFKDDLNQFKKVDKIAKLMGNSSKEIIKSYIKVNK